MLEILESNSREQEYIEYLENHIGGVKEAFSSVSDILQEVLDEYTYNEASLAITLHDESKYDPAEFDAYLNHYYPADYGDIKPDEEDIPYQLAWLHHIHNNAHHWQHWILIHDEGNFDVMDMPTSEVIAMICDWHSFSKKNPKSTAYKWYQDNGDSMMLSDNTRAEIEKYIEYFKEPLK